MDRYVETTRRGWFSRAGGSFGGALFGLLIFVIAFPLLFWNEGRAVRRAKDLAYGKEAVVAVKSDKPVKANEGKLVSVSGKAKVAKKPKDPVFVVSADALSLRREVEMYQWKEESSSSKKTKAGGSEETTTEYTYDKVWSDSSINSGGFKISAGHRNPDRIPFDGATFVSPSVKLGGFALGPSFVGKLPAGTKLQVSKVRLPTEGRLHAGGVYVGDSPTSPRVGDVRVFWFIAAPGTLTVIGNQSGNELGPYKDEEMNDPVALIERGKKSSDEMFQSAQDANWFLTWMFRLLGFILMFAGLRLAARPLAVIGSVIPFVGKVIGFGTGLVAFFVAIAFSAMTVAVAWIFYRPLFGVLLIVAACGAIVIAVVAAKKLSD